MKPEKFLSSFRICALMLVMTMASCIAEDGSKKASTPNRAAMNPSECVLPELGKLLPAMTANGITPNNFNAPSIAMLSLLSTKAIGTGKSSPTAAISMAPLLPDGGISGSDTCGPIAAFRSVGDGSYTSFIGVRLHPSLDLAVAYPAYGAELAKSEQVIQTPPQNFAAYAENTVSIEDLLRDLSLAPDTLIWNISDLLLVPLE